MFNIIRHEGSTDLAHVQRTVAARAGSEAAAAQGGEDGWEQAARSPAQPPRKAPLFSVHRNLSPVTIDCSPALKAVGTLTAAGVGVVVGHALLATDRSRQDIAGMAAGVAWAVASGVMATTVTILWAIHLAVES